MSAITVRKVWKEFGDQIVLEAIDLDIASRSFVALVGPSGCGKTTFLRMLLSEETPTRGDILIDGEKLPREPGVDRGVVFQRYSVFPHLTVLGNVVLGLEFSGSRVFGRLVGAKRRAAEETARELLAGVGLAGAEEKYPAQLSGGMQQRLALAQALVAKPKVLLLDEPFGALDPGIRRDIHTLVRRIWHERPLTIVMVTHDLSEAFTLATRIVAFDRRRNEPSDGGRYGATITRDIPVWPLRIAGAPPFSESPKHGRDDPAATGQHGRDDPAIEQALP